MRWLKNLEGATAVEYGLIVGGIAVAVGLALFAMGDKLNVSFGIIIAQIEKVL